MYEQISDFVPLDAPLSQPLSIACDNGIFDCTLQSCKRIRRRLVQISQVGLLYCRGNGDVPCDVETLLASAATDFYAKNPQMDHFNLCVDYFGVTIVCYFDLIRKL